MIRVWKIAGVVSVAVPCALSAQGAASLATKVLNPPEVTAVAPRVKSIRVEPTTLTLRVGETVSFSKLTVTVFDSAGKPFGRLGGYDFGIKPGEPATAMPRQVTGVRVGTTELQIFYPRNAWKERKDPRAEAKVKIVVVK